MLEVILETMLLDVLEVKRLAQMTAE